MGKKLEHLRDAEVYTSRAFAGLVKDAQVRLHLSVAPWDGPRDDGFKPVREAICLFRAVGEALAAARR